MIITTLNSFMTMFVIIIILFSGCKKDNSSNSGSGVNAVLLTTAPATNITNTTATTGGLISGGGGSPVIERGVCWSITPDPTIADSSTATGSGIGSYVSIISGLSPSTSYFIKAYAITSNNIYYGNQLTFSTTGIGGSIDTIPPVIILNGSNQISIDLQQTYVELGATAIDNVDGQLQTQITGSIDVNLKGQYIITYTAVDAAGNSATEDRIVDVVNSADLLAGAYINATDNCNAGGPATFNATVTTSNTQNGKFSISNFGAFGTSITIDLSYNKQNQTITGAAGQSLGTGAVLTAVTSGQLLGQSPVSFSIGYTWIDSGGATDFCTSTYTK